MNASRTMGKFPYPGWKYALLAALALAAGRADAFSLREGLVGRTGLALESGLAKPVLTEKADAWTVSFPKGFLVKRELARELFTFHYFRSDSRWAENAGPGQSAGITFASRADADRLTNHFYVVSLEHPVKSFWKFDNYLSFGLGLNNWKMTDSSGAIKKLEDLNGRPFDARDDRIILAFGAGGEFFFNDFMALDLGGDLYYNTKILSQFRGDRDIKARNHYGLFNALTGLHARLNFYIGRQRDTDGDGVPDKRDACPNSRPGEVVDCDGCSLDQDADGVPDWLDLCPNTPYGTKVDGDGCPIQNSSAGTQN